jgi:hypothetical protein
VGGTSGTTPFADWNSASSYSVGNIVTVVPASYYRSLESGNIGNDPTTSPSVWEEVFLLGDTLVGTTITDSIIVDTDISGGTATDVDISGGTATDVEISGGTITDIAEVVYDLVDLDIDPANGGIQTKTIAADTTFTESLDDGQSVVLMLTDAVSYTITWPTMTWISSGGNAAPELTDSDVVVMWQVGTTVYGLWSGSGATV